MNKDNAVTIKNIHFRKIRWDTAGKVCILVIGLLFMATKIFAADQPIIIDHTCSDIYQIPQSAVLQAKSDLHIAYGHTSHGQQISEGLRALDQFMTSRGYPSGTYALDYLGGGNNDPAILDFRDARQYTSTVMIPGAYDLGRSVSGTDYTAWIQTTRDTIADFPELNVIIWAWCGQVSYCSDQVIIDYLNNMSQLEEEYPNIQFVYMTGHVDGTGLEGTLHRHNEMIRAYCRENNKILYDFADIESYDPDGNYFGDKRVDDSCCYDANGNGVVEMTDEASNDYWPSTPLNGDRNWALDWQDSHVLGVDWYESPRIRSYHTQHLNHNLKAYAAWWLFARLAGWQGSDTADSAPAAPTNLAVATVVEN
jgi:hypothetical protein